ncbi:MAG: pyridoxine 5'-phosphate synthase [Desulfobacterales bacterium]|nr:pyridoxine 5'-phosphate synthase [Desulfobacterales bacterium]
MARLAVNVDHVATVRQARGTNEPDPVFAAAIAELAGAEGIICHLREDRRHIQDRDVRILRETVRTRLNLEMAAVPEMVRIAGEILPDLVTLVPEKRQEVTTEGGLDVLGNPELYRKVVEELKEKSIEVSLFVDPDPRQIEIAHTIGGDVVEIHTGHYADARTGAETMERFERIAQSAILADSMKLGVSAGHGLNYVNVKRFGTVPQITEYSIGHSIVARAVTAGFEKAVREMIELVKGF